MRGDAEDEAGHAGTTDGPVHKMAGPDRSAGQRSSRASKRGTRTTATGLAGDNAFDQSSGAAGPESNGQRGAYVPGAAGHAQKKYLLKKNQFESDLAFPTGRFDDVGTVGENTKEQFSKSANHAKVLRIINATSLVPGTAAEDAPGMATQIGRADGETTKSRAPDPGRSGEGAAVSLPGGFNDGPNPSSQEQEMRETSYFKQ